MDLIKAFVSDDVSLLQVALEHQQDSRLSTRDNSSLIFRAIRHNALRCLEHMASSPDMVGDLNASRENGQNALAVAAGIQPRLIPVLIEQGVVYQDDNKHGSVSPLRSLTTHLFNGEVNKASYDYIGIFKLLMQAGARVSCGNMSILYFFCLKIELYVTDALNRLQRSPDCEHIQSVALRMTIKGNNLYECLDFIAANSTNDDLIAALCFLIRTQRHVVRLNKYPSHMEPCNTGNIMIPILHCLHAFVCAIQKYTDTNDVQVEYKSPLSLLVESLYDTHYINTNSVWDSHRAVHTSAVKELLHTGRQLVGYPCYETTASMTHICVLLSENHELFAPLLNAYLDHHNVSRATGALKTILTFIDQVFIDISFEAFRSQLEDGSVKRYLEHKLDCIMSLKHLARRRIVRNITLDRYISDLDQLPLPSALKQYLVS